MLVWVLLLSVARADCALERTEAWRDGEFHVSLSGTVSHGPVPCSRVELGLANEVDFTEIRADVVAWDDTRRRFGLERARIEDGVWVMHLPELRDSDRLKLDASGVAGPRWPEASGSVEPIRTRIRWLGGAKPSFGPKGNVGMEIDRTVELVGRNAVAHLWFPHGSAHHRCAGSGLVTAGAHGCALQTGDADSARFDVGWTEAWATSSEEYELGDRERLYFSDVRVESAGLDQQQANQVIHFAGPGRISFRLTELNGVPVPDSALADVQYGARAQSMPEPAIGLAFKGAELAVKDLGAVLDLVRSQVSLGRLPGAHPLKPRRLMEVRSSGWATPFESALMLTRYLEQLGFSAQALPVRPVSTGPVAPGAPVGFTGAVVVAEKDGQRAWLDPSCRACGLGEVDPALWSGVVFHDDWTTLPGPPHSSFEQSQTQSGLSIRIEGVAAVRLRQTIMAMPTQTPRGPAIAELFGGEGARLKSIDGLADLGAPIVLSVETQSRR